MKKVGFIITFFAQLTCLAGGGWTQKKGEGFFLLSQRMISGHYYFNSNKQVIQSPLLSVYTTNIYGEYGFTNKFTGIIYSPVLTSLSRAGGVDSSGTVFVKDKATGFGDIDVGMKYNLLNKKINISATLFLGINSGNYYGGATKTLHLGDNEFSQMLKIEASRGFKHHLFATVFVAFNNRTKHYSDDLQYGGEFGYSKNKLTAILKVYCRTSLFNEPRKDSPIPGIYSDNLEYYSLTPQLLYTLKYNIGVMAEAGFALGSRNVLAVPSISLGVYWNLKKREAKKSDQ